MYTQVDDMDDIGWSIYGGCLIPPPRVSSSRRRLYASPNIAPFPLIPWGGKPVWKLSIPPQPLLRVALQFVRRPKPPPFLLITTGGSVVTSVLDLERRVRMRVLRAAKAGVSEVVEGTVGDLEVADELWGG